MSRPVALGSELTSTNTNTSDNAGASVAASADGTRIAYGVYRDNQGGTDAGAVRIFDWNGTAWTQVGTDIQGNASSQYFGVSVALSDDGSRVVVGANGGNLMRVYDYDTGTSDWVQTGSDITGTSGTQFGWTVDCSGDGDTVVVGSWNAGTGGEVEVWEWSGTAWTQVGANISTGAASGDSFGRSVSISQDGSRIAVGSIFDDTPASGAGSVRIFDWNGTAWAQVGTDITGVTGADNEGISVWLSSDGSRVATGASNATLTGFGTSASGRARVFEYDTGTSDWVQMGTEIYGLLTSNLARIVSLSGDGTRLAVGAINGESSSTPTVSNVGNIRVFDWNGHEWAQFDDTLFLSSPASSDALGHSVALSRDGLTLVGGAYQDDPGATNAGSVKIWSVPAATWTQQGSDLQFTLSASAEDFGFASDFSSDGSRCVVGAYDYPSNAGAFEVFEFNETTSDWDSIGTKTFSSGSRLGHSVAMSSDGNTVVLGGPLWNSWSGTVEVYDYGGGTTWTRRGSALYGSTSYQFGNFVDISDDGNTIVISASGANRVYVYDWNGSAWTQRTLLTGTSNFGFGVSISSDGDTVAVGSVSASQIQVYNWSGSAWSQVGSTISSSGSFGESLALSSDGTRLIGGASSESSNTGKAEVYDWNGTAWVQVGSTISGVQTGERSGRGVGIVDDGSRIAVAAPYYHNGGAEDTGKVRIFDYDSATSDWVQVGQNINGETSTELTGQYRINFDSTGAKVLVNGAGYDSPATDDGRVRVFQIVKAPGFKYWDGTAFVDSTAVQYWNGTAWTDVTGIQYWNGSAWTDPS